MNQVTEGGLVGLRAINLTNYNKCSGTLNRDGAVTTDRESLIKVAGAAKIDTLEKWWADFSGRNGANAFNALNTITVNEARGEGLKIKKATVSDLLNKVEPGMGDKQTMQEVKKGDFSEVYGRLQRVITQNRDAVSKLYYTSCAMKVERKYADGRTVPDSKCQKKVVDGNCAECGMVSEEMRENRWIARVYMQDATDSTIMNAFDTEFTALNGGTNANDAVNTHGSDERLAEWAKFAAYRGLFKLRVKTTLDEAVDRDGNPLPNTDPGTWRPRHTVTSAAKLEGAELGAYAHTLLEGIAAIGKAGAVKGQAMEN